jgi:hypothetical protein
MGCQPSWGVGRLGAWNRAARHRLGVKGEARTPDSRSLMWVNATQGFAGGLSSSRRARRQQFNNVEVLSLEEFLPGSPGSARDFQPTPPMDSSYELLLAQIRAAETASARGRTRLFVACGRFHSPPRRTNFRGSARVAEWRRRASTLRIASSTASNSLPTSSARKRSTK